MPVAGWPCVVCGSIHAEPHNPILVCDRCDAVVHARCYAARAPRGGRDWFCEPCRAVRRGHSREIAAFARAEAEKAVGASVTLQKPAKRSVAARPAVEVTVCPGARRPWPWWLRRLYC